MNEVFLRPEMRTAGGEACDIVLNGKFVGTLNLVYREGERIFGSVQLDRESVNRKTANYLMRHVQNYVQSLIDALQVTNCQVIVTHSQYDHIIATGDDVGEVVEIMDRPAAAAPKARETREVREALEVREVRQARETREPRAKKPAKARDAGPAAAAPAKRRTGLPKQRKQTEDMTDYLESLELVIVGESRNQVEYHVYNSRQRLIAEAFMKYQKGGVIGDINWLMSPEEEDMDAVTELIVNDFDSNEVDTFDITMFFEGEEIASIELNHEDFHIGDSGPVAEVEEDHYDVLLIRDDEDALTYEVYSEFYGDRPVALATVDISKRELTGMIDFFEPGSKEEREFIATLILRELDKEKDFSLVSFTMTYQNDIIDEIAFDSRKYEEAF